MYFELFDIPLLLMLFAFLAIASYTDIRESKIKNWTVLTFLTLRVLYAFVVPITTENLFGMLFGCAVFFIPAFIINRPAGGDIKAYSVIGFYLGLGMIMPHFIFTWVVTLIVYGAMIITKKYHKNKKVQMAPIFLISMIPTLFVVHMGWFDVASKQFLLMIN